jgi:C1A family cysteine protease
MSKYIYNHRPQQKDSRDLQFHLTVPQLTTLPSHVDLRASGYMPPVLDQGFLGSCVANATSNALRYCLRKEKLKDWLPSRLYIYYYSRLIENTVNEDSGAVIRDVMKAVHTYGACSENNWGYDITKFTIHPPTNAVRAGLSHVKSFQYLAVNQDLISIKNALVMGYPIIFGIAVFESLETDIVMQTGDIPIPNTQTEKCLGGHAILMTGYSDETQRFTFLNSWGDQVGKQGYFTLPYAYVLDPSLCSDLWTCKYFN